MKSFIKKLIEKCRIVFLFPFLIFSIFNFILRNIFFDFNNACNYLKALPAQSLIPILRLRGAKIGKNCDIQSGITFHNCKNFKNLSIGDNCHIGKDCFFDLRDKIEINDNVVISMRSMFITHIDMSKSSLSELYPAKSAGIKISRDVYLGAGVTVLMGVEVGAYAFIGASSLVNKSVVKNTVVAGIPAKKVLNVK